MNSQKLKDFLDDASNRYNNPSFIAMDPICIPHGFSLKQDREIIGFWTAMLSWGQRKTIINKSHELINLMGASPYDFILNHSEKDRKRFKEFKHRTFNYLDSLYFLQFLQHCYQNFRSMEDVFVAGLKDKDLNVENALIHFHDYFFSLKHAPKRTRKHVATPARNSRCKRLNMFLRWMVRSDDKGVDFGIWKGIKASQLLIPLDVHVERVARELGLIERKQNDWKTVLELTERLSSFCPEDPVKYDFALFGIGVLQKKAALDKSALL